MRIKMKVISEDDAAGGQVQEGSRRDPAVVRGSGPHTFVCGSCAAVLVEGVRFGQVESMSVRCAACGSMNAVPQVMGGDGQARGEPSE